LCDILNEGDINMCDISEHWLSNDKNSRYDYVRSASKTISKPCVNHSIVC